MRTLTVEETVVEVSIKNSPIGARMLTKPYPKDNEPRTMGLPTTSLGSSPNRSPPAASVRRTCCSPPATAPPSPATPAAPRIWLPAIKASGIGFEVRVHDLRHAHASCSWPGDLTSSP